METEVMHEKLLRAFIKVKKDVVELKAIVRMHEDIIKKLNENERALYLKIKSMEAKASQKPKVVTRVVTKKVPKIITKVVTKEVKKVVKSYARKEYVGAKSSMRLHSKNCPFAQNIKRSNKVIFQSKIKPFNMGYKACECLK